MSIINDEQARICEYANIGRDILSCAQNELYLNMRFLDIALSSLTFCADENIQVAGTDGRTLYYNPEQLAGIFLRGRVPVNRLYLHCIFHCLFAHLWTRSKNDEKYWDLACDIAVEHVIDYLDIQAVHRPVPAARREIYREFENMLPGQSPVLTAQRICRCLIKLDPDESLLAMWKTEFCADDHSRWDDGKDGSVSEPVRQQWDDARDRMQTEMETFGKDASADIKSLEEQLQAENRSHYDYREFLRKFSVLKEEMKVDMDSFDYIYYNYGMELYGNMPLIEPLETKEVKRIEDFVIVIDTSMSCQGDLLLHFLEETCNILSESESFFRKIHIHILQCDNKVQEDVLITNREEMKNYMEHFTVRGYGGTDFRPPFARVEELMKKHCFTKLRGLIYFTDGYGIFPARKPPYDTAFVFLREDYRDVDVPEWAVKLIIDREEIMGET